MHAWPPYILLLIKFFCIEISTYPSIWQEYKISSFEQRLMNEIEFRLERTPVDESDDEIQHDEIPTGKCIAPIFDKRLKHFRVTEGSPVTFTCKIVGIPVPKVGKEHGLPVDQQRGTIHKVFRKISWGWDVVQCQSACRSWL